MSRRCLGYALLFSAVLWSWLFLIVFGVWTAAR
jgi:hypothetical protein